MPSYNVWHRYAYAWLTILFFAVSLGLHWLFGWYAYANEAAEHAQTPQVSDYLVIMGRDTFENWQSEFLQLLWQVVGLAYFLYVGSPSSKENDDRMEAKIDALIRLQAGEKGEALLAAIDREFLRKGGHATPHNE
jgi:cbb3-type cytochrome oxidase subunit 3